MSSSQLFLVQEDENDTRFQTSLKDASQRPESPDGPDEIAPGGPEFQAEENDIHPADDKKEDRECIGTSVSSTESQKPSLGQSQLADEDDGFKTPTSSEHKIPVLTECPPAPAPKRFRRNPAPTKRKALPRIRRNLQIDLSREVELTFPPTVEDDDFGSKIKKARREDSS